jgi:hypothetical protein
MTSAQRLRLLAAKCDELARAGLSEEMRARQAALADTYRGMADRDEWLDAQVSPFARDLREGSVA